MGELFWKGKSLAEQFQHTVGAKKKKKSLNSLETIRETDFTYITSPQGGTAQDQERSSWPMISPAGELRVCE